MNCIIEGDTGCWTLELEKNKGKRKNTDEQENQDANYRGFSNIWTADNFRDRGVPLLQSLFEHPNHLTNHLRCEDMAQSTIYCMNTYFSVIPYFNCPAKYKDTPR